jgi:protein-disulfide isomerase
MSRILSMLNRLALACVALAAVALISLAAMKARENERPAPVPAAVDVTPNPGKRAVQNIEADHLTVEASALRVEPTSGSGVPGLPVLIEFSDFECPYCASFARTTLKEIRRTYVDAGTLQYAFVNFPLVAIHPAAMTAGRAAECARTSGQFWPIHDWLFESQRRLDRASITRRVTEMGIDKDCLARDGKDIVSRDLDLAMRLGVRSTPTLFLGTTTATGSVILRRRIRGLQPYSVFKDAIDELGRGQARSAIVRVTVSAERVVI